VTLLLPKGILGTFNAWWGPREAKQMSDDTLSAALEDGVGEAKPAE
jgi:urea transport system permease protein